ncbi:MAG: tRNA uridine-5-carboxymethylaminomethyl(34) synthesis GTPase MnmE [Agarilytica sp.]
MSAYHPDTICSVATPPGRGGVGIVRVSGPKCLEIASKILKITPKVRYAHYGNFYSGSDILDQGIALYFAGPHSFTGEEVLELQGHGGPIILDLLVNELLKHGARLAEPGEFSQRAFLNDKLDLTQAEAIADLIDASSQQATKQALNTLKGDFSKKINTIVDKITHLRLYVESSIDFPEEEIDFLSDGKVASMLEDLKSLTETTLSQAQQGVLLRDGMKIVIAGRPNAGKSSLLNQLAGRDLAIVTDIAGTTRDVLREDINIDGLPLHIVDTAGLRDSPDQVEKIGIERAWKEIEEADQILLMIDSTDEDQLDVDSHWEEFVSSDEYNKKLTVIYNKIDESSFKISKNNTNYHEIAISALEGSGIDDLKDHLKTAVGYQGTVEGGFSARRRHIAALEQALSYIDSGEAQLSVSAGELLAEDLKVAQNYLSEITGAFTADDLLGQIFSSFCIGK